MIPASDVSAVIPTRGDVDLLPIIESLAACAEIIVWDNSVEDYDMKVWGRYAAITRASMPVIYTQDDDCLIDVERVVAAYKPRFLVANMPYSRWNDYSDSALVGWGAVFDRGLPDRAFAAYYERYPEVLLPNTQPNDRFLRTCDVVFSTLTPHEKIDVGFAHLPWAEREGRMFRQVGHKLERDHALDEARRVRDRYLSRR